MQNPFTPCIISKGTKRNDKEWFHWQRSGKKPKKSINKNINKKSFTQSTPNIAEKLDNEMVAFLDTEFLTSQIKGGPPAKLVSVGFVVCGKNFEEVTRFHSYIYAEDKLHDRFQEMTGIERKDLLSARIMNL